MSSSSSPRFMESRTSDGEPIRRIGEMLRPWPPVKRCMGLLKLNAVRIVVSDSGPRWGRIA